MQQQGRPGDPGLPCFHAPRWDRSQSTFFSGVAGLTGISGFSLGFSTFGSSFLFLLEGDLAADGVFLDPGSDLCVVSVFVTGTAGATTAGAMGRGAGRVEMGGIGGAAGTTGASSACRNVGFTRV